MSSFALAIFCRPSSSTATRWSASIQRGWINFSIEERGHVALPDMTIDMDGVLCRPVVWFNLVISRDIRRAPDVEARKLGSAPSLPSRLLESRPSQVVRYAWRRPMPRVSEGLEKLAEMRRLILLSGRPEISRKSTERWLVQHGLRDYFSEIVLNDGRLSNAAFKLVTLRERGVVHHIDDDGRVAYFLTQDASRTVFLIAWRRNDGLPYPPTVQRVQDLLEAAERLGSSSLLDSRPGALEWNVSADSSVREKPMGDAKRTE